MEFLFPAGVILFALAVFALLRKHDVTWSARMTEMERRDAEIRERLGAKRSQR